MEENFRAAATAAPTHGLAANCLFSVLRLVTSLRAAAVTNILFRAGMTAGEFRGQ